jgi:hypothetical protein
MKKQFFVLLLFALAAYGQERVAIIQTLDDRDSIGVSELAYLTDRLRETAVDVLPKPSYGVMTTENIIAFLGTQERAAKECREASCLAELGRKVNADYVGQARVGRFGENLTIKTEFYNSNSGNLVGSFTGDAKDIFGLLAIIDEKAPALFRKMMGEAEGTEAEGNATETKNEKRIHIGARVYGGQIMSPQRVQVTKAYGEKEESIGVGLGGGFGIFALIPLFGIYLVPEISYQHRVPINGFEPNNVYDVWGGYSGNNVSLTVTEDLIQIPLLFRFRYSEENIVYLGIGLFLEILLNVEDNQDGAFKNYRSNPDFGLIYELGFLISDGFSIEIRCAMNMGRFDAGAYLGTQSDSYHSSGKSFYSLMQSQYGVSYAF